jgi:hypothetical protein
LRSASALASAGNFLYPDWRTRCSPSEWFFADHFNLVRFTDEIVNDVALADIFVARDFGMEPKVFRRCKENTLSS